MGAAGSGRVVTLEIGCVIHGTVSPGKGILPWNCGHVALGAAYERKVTEETVDL